MADGAAETVARHSYGKLVAFLASRTRDVAAAQDALADAFAEVKRYEIAAANRLLAKHKRLDQINQAQLDEVALTGFRRKDR